MPIVYLAILLYNTFNQIKSYGGAMPVNIKNEKALNDYIARLVYHGGEPDTFSKTELKDADFITQEKDKIIRAMTYQWMKTNVRNYLTDKQDAPFLERIEHLEDDITPPKWLKDCLAAGKPVYIFDQSKVPDSFHADLQNITDYLYTVGDNYIGKVLEHESPNINLGALKDRPEHKSFVLTLKQADKWHERIAAEAAERKVDEAEKQALLERTDFIMDLGDSFTAVQLMTPEALDKESDYMGHCVGKGGYDEGVRNGSIQIYSIRDANGEPHATFEVRKKVILQCKGKANRSITPKYVPYVQKFVTNYGLNPENDLKNIGLCKDINGHIHNLYNIPAGTEFDELDLSFMNFETWPDLTKAKIQRLEYTNSSSLISLESLPEKLEEFICYCCSSLSSLEGLPKELKKLNCRYCDSLTSLKGLPEGLEELNCSSCFSLASLEGAPKGLERLDCSSCFSLASLEGAPKGLEVLNCSSCSSLASLEGAPKGLKKIDCSYCKSLTSLNGLQEGLEELNCTYCNSLTSLDGAPQGLKKLDCRWCDSLKYIPDYIPDTVLMLSADKIAECKANWRALQKEKEAEVNTASAVLKQGAER